MVETRLKENVLTDSLVQFIENQKFESIPPSVVARAKLSIIDSIGVTLLGSKHPTIEIAIKHIQTQGGNPLCSIIGHSLKTSPLFAAWVNGMSGHVLDFEMMWNPPCHPCSSLLPALWALSDQQPVRGKQFLASYVVGLEVLARLLLLTGNRVPTLFHPQAIAGQLGCVSASSHLLGLKKNALRHALGITASCCCGLMANVGSMTKCLHSGMGSMSGLQSALLAQEGFTANPAILDYEPGIFHAFFGSLSTEVLVEHLVKKIGKPYWLEAQNFALKRYPCQYGTHFAIEAALKMRQSHRIDPNSIVSIELEFPEFPYISRKKLLSPLEGKFSLQYLLASAFVDGNVTEATFHATMMQRPIIHTLMSSTTISYNRQLKPTFEDMTGLLTVHLINGSTFQEICSKPVGHWDNLMTEDLIRNKFHEILSPYYSTHWIEELLHSLSHLEQCPNMSDILQKMNANA